MEVLKASGIFFSLFCFEAERENQFAINSQLGILGVKWESLVEIFGSGGILS